MTDKHHKFREADLPPRVAIWALEDSGFEYNGVVYMMEWGNFEGDPPELHRLIPGFVGPSTRQESEIGQVAVIWAQSDYSESMPLAEFLNATLGDA